MVKNESSAPSLFEQHADENARSAEGVCNLMRLSDFVENPDNPQTVTDAAFDRLVEKLKRVPIGLTASRIAYVTDHSAGRYVVLSGNKRLRALKRIHGDDYAAPAEWFQDITSMTEEQRREYIVSANVNEGEWDVDKLLAQYDRDDLTGLVGPDELSAILSDIEKKPDMSVTDDDGAPTDQDGQEYHDFVDKFKAKHTTDDCYTPPNIYEAILDWCVKHYGIKARDVVRPFKPGGNYQAEEYKPGAVVLDNPPFSILSEICTFYNEHGIKFFLFAPGLTPFSCGGKFNTLICGITITYANGAGISTSFITNMGEYLIETAPDLYDTLKAINLENERKDKKDFPSYSYPDCVITASAIKYLNIHHTDFKLKREDAIFIRCLDEQKEHGAGLFGGGYLLSERAAAERAAAERAVAERAVARRWNLSERERELQKTLGAKDQPK